MAILLGSPAAFAWQNAPGADTVNGLDPADESSAYAATMLLCADDGPAACSMGQRIAAIEWLRRFPAPEAGPALLRVFARSRFGELPEDPDLFERAQRAVALLPPDAQRLAVADGLAPALVDLTWNRLLTRWLVPLAEGQDADTLRRLRGWPVAHPDEYASLATAIEDAVLAGYDNHGPAFVDAMAAERGSLAEAAAQHAEDRLLATLLRSEDPAIVAIAVAVVAGGPLGGPETLQALDHAWRNPALPDDLRDTAREPSLRRALERPLPPVAPTETIPGHRAGSDARAPTQPMDDFIVHREGPSQPGSLGWLGGALLLALLGTVAGLRGSHQRLRAAGALAIGVSITFFAEGLLRATGAHSLAERAPLFAFYRADKPLLTNFGASLVVSPGGPIRHQALQWPKPPATLHIATVGASTAHGSHYLTEEIFSTLVVERLQTAAPAVRVKSLNLAIGGAASDAVRQGGLAALQHGADALVICLGHNEAAAFSRFAVWDPKGAKLMRVQLALAQSSLYGALSSVIPHLSRRPALPTGRPDRAQQARLLDLAEQNLRWNLGALLDAAGRADVPAIVVIPPTNWRFVHLEPWATPGPGDARDLKRRMQKAETLALNGTTSGAGARRMVQSAIDNSASPRELTSGVKQAIVEVAADKNATLVRADLLFDAWAPDGLSASGLFWDDLHPTRQGHALLADAISAAVAPRVGVSLPQRTGS